MPGATTGVCQAVRAASSISQGELSRRRSSQCQCDRLTGHDWQVKPLVNCLLLLLHFPSDVASRRAGMPRAESSRGEAATVASARYLFVSEILSRRRSRKSAFFEFLPMISCAVEAFGSILFLFFLSNPPHLTPTRWTGIISGPFHPPSTHTHFFMMGYLH